MFCTLSLFSIWIFLMYKFTIISITLTIVLHVITYFWVLLFAIIVFTISIIHDILTLVWMFVSTYFSVITSSFTFPKFAFLYFFLFSIIFFFLVFLCLVVIWYFYNFIFIWFIFYIIAVFNLIFLCFITFILSIINSRGLLKTKEVSWTIIFFLCILLEITAYSLRRTNKYHHVE